MDKVLLNWLLDNRKMVGIVAIAICTLAWASELTDLVYVCPYCRAQRTIIGILGLSLLLPNPRNWINLYLASTIAAFGFLLALFNTSKDGKKSCLVSLNGAKFGLLIHGYCLAAHCL